ncbi:terpene synthase [Colletotrichum asianum]
MGSLISEAQEILGALRGEILHVPDLREIFKDWPVDANTNYKEIIPVVESAFDRLVRNPGLREKYRKANYARFTQQLLTEAYFKRYYPHPNQNEIHTLALYIVWLFCWDDAIDQQGSDLSANLARAKTYRNDTICVLNEALGLSTASTNTHNTTCDHVNAELITIGAELCKAYNCGGRIHPLYGTLYADQDTEQRQTFMNQMRRYIENCDKEQSLRLRGTLPSMEAYKDLRHGTAAVWTLCALIEYGLGESLPEHIRCMTQLQTLWAETSRGIWITNDILSLKKEIPKDDRADESIVNAIPILMVEEGKSPQQAVDALLADLAVSVATFKGAANTLAEAAGEGRQAVLRYCDACRCMVTGSIQFTFDSTRYKLGGCMNADGSLDIPL